MWLDNLFVIDKRFKRLYFSSSSHRTNLPILNLTALACGSARDGVKIFGKISQWVMTLSDTVNWSFQNLLYQLKPINTKSKQSKLIHNFSAKIERQYQWIAKWMNDWNTIKRFVCTLIYRYTDQQTQTAGFDLFSPTLLIDSCFLCCKI